jgi:DedD protein
MDRRVKERLIGASILGVLVVAIVPELLSGPKPPATTVFPAPASAPAATRTITVPVDALTSGAVSAEPAAPSSRPAAPDAAPPVDAQQSVTAPLENQPSAPTSEPRPEVSTPLPSPALAGPAPKGGWAVQLGSFASKANAEKLAHEVGGKGFSPYVSSIGSGASSRYRVRVGPFAARAEAERTLARLKSQGLAATLAASSGP